MGGRATAGTVKDVGGARAFLRFWPTPELLPDRTGRRHMDRHAAFATIEVAAMRATPEAKNGDVGRGVEHGFGDAVIAQDAIESNSMNTTWSCARFSQGRAAP